MPIISKKVSSSVGKKFIMGLSGLVLIGFVAGHLFGNLLLFSENPDPFNSYSHFLVNLGTLLYIVEFGLIISIILHIIVGVSVFAGGKTARPVPYHTKKSAGKPSRMNFSSLTMIYTGIILGVFIVLHVMTFKYGPNYTTTVDGVEMRDLYRLVTEIFNKEWYVAWYVFAMVFLGFHLRHGFWSAFQSLAFYHPRYTPFIYGLGYVVSILLSLGFIVMPLWIYFMRGA